MASVDVGIDYGELAEQLGIRGRLGGQHHLYAPCPLHDDRAPSFSLNLRTGLWYCHTEQRGGDFAQLVMEMKGIGLRAAVRWVLRAASMLPPEREAELLPDTFDWDMQVYDALDPNRMPSYWFERGYTWEDADRWGVRYDPSAQYIYIPYRFPFNGPIEGFIRRAADPHRRPKYKNALGLARNDMLFGYGARSDAGACLLVEGPLDAINADRHGFAACALLGLHLSERQMALLRRIENNVVIALDPDTEGQERSHVIHSRLQRRGIRCWEFAYTREQVEHGVDIGAMDRRDIESGILAAAGLRLA